MTKLIKKFFKALKSVKFSKTYKIALGVVILLGILYLGRSLILVALVNNRPVFRLSLLRKLEQQGGSQVLESLVNENLILHEASVNKISVSKDEIDKQLSQIEEGLKKQNLTLDTALQIQGQTKDELIRNLRIKIILEKLLKDKITVTEDEIKSFFNTNSATYPKGTKLQDVKDDIFQQLSEEKLSSEYQTWLKAIREKAKIIYFINY